MSEEQVVTPVAKVLVPISERGAFIFGNHTELAQAAQMLMKLKIAPDHLRKEGVEAVGAAMIFCRQFGLPDKAMNEMAWVKGKLTQFGSLVTALAERHHQYGEKREFFLDEKQDEICSRNKNLNAKVWAAVAQIRKKGQEHWTEFYFTMDEAQTAELMGNPTWKKYPKDMLMHKARARAFKAEYASALNGVDYHEDVVEALEREVHSLDETKSLNEFFKPAEGGKLGNPDSAATATA